MSLTDWFKRLFSSSPPAESAEEGVATEPAGQDAPAGEQDVVRDEGAADVDQMKLASGGAGAPGQAASQGAEAAEAQLSDYEPPADQTP
jgi:hypothetical protein